MKNLFKLIRASSSALILLCTSFDVFAYEVRQIDLITSSLIADPVSKTLYASIPGQGGALGNSVLKINPVTGDIGTAVFVGSEPSNLAISDDGTVLYVSLDGAFAIRRITLQNMSAGQQFSLGADSFFGPYLAEDIAVEPGNANVIAVSLKNQGISPRHAGVAIFDNGVQRTNKTQRHTGSNRVEYSDNTAIVYGYNNETSEFGFRELHVNSNGITEYNVTENFISGYGVDIKYSGGVIYSTNGRVLNPVGPVILGTYPVGYAFDLAIDSVKNRIYFLTQNSIEVFDSTKFVLLESIAIPNINGTPENLVQWGTDSLAFRTSGGQLFFVDTSNNFLDTDDDGVADASDNCPAVANSEQLDQDGDGLGDVCDPFPNNPRNDLAQCELDRDAALALLLGPDQDGDGESDVTDRCKNTPKGAEVDDSGCSIEQFCEKNTKLNACLNSDWKNDEPNHKPNDCQAKPRTYSIYAKPLACLPRYK